MSTWQLLCGDEVIDTVNLKTDNYEEAHTYYRLRKNLDNDTFNKLFIVKEYIKPVRPMGKIEWWKGEPNQLDDF